MSGSDWGYNRAMLRSFSFFFIVPILALLFGQCRLPVPIQSSPASEGEKAMEGRPAPGPTDYSDLVTGTDPVSTRVVRLQVPLVQQPRAPLCGPASIEMVFRYWGENRYSQYDIARSITIQFKDEGRFKNSDILKEVSAHQDNQAIDWKLYPGTGTYNMREFLARFAPTRNPRIKILPKDPDEAEKVRDRFFRDLRGHLDSGAPAIVHQWYSSAMRSQHYRVVTGYDDQQMVVFLNDPVDGAIQQSYSSFLELWKVEEPWLPYNFIVFNAYAPGQIKKGALRVDL